MFRKLFPLNTVATFFGTGSKRSDKAESHKKARRVRLVVEGLEERLVPAHNITLGTAGQPALAAAIASANADPGSTITFTVDDVVLLSSALPAITSPTTFNATGHSVTIDGGGLNRVFLITGPENVVFRGDANTSAHPFTIQNGYVASGNGGGILAADPGASVTLINIALLNNTAATGNGGGVYSGGTLGIYNSLVDGNTAGNFGGGAYAGKQMNIDSSVISDNRAAYGAGVYEAFVAPVVISGTSSFTTFSHNIASVDGGGVYAGYDVTVNNFTNFDQNTASDSGGGIYSLAGNVTLGYGPSPFGISLTNNVAATGNGGGVFAFKNVSGSHVVIATNYAGILGGGIASLGNVTIGANSFIGYIQGSTSFGNTAEFGGGIYAAKDVKIGGSTLVSGNTASINGGGIYSSGDVVIDPSIVSGNTASGSGGGIYESGTGTVAVVASFVFQNTANIAGGGIFSQSGVVYTVTSAIFLNRAGAGGGGIYDGTGSVQLFQPSIIDNNTAGSGGGIYIGSGADLQTGAVFGASVGVPSVPAGSLLATYTALMTAHPNTIIISNNTAIAGGGGIDAVGTQGVTLVNTWVENNTVSGATGQGGGMLATNVANVSLSYDTFSGSLAKSAQGGGLAVISTGPAATGSSVHVDDSTFGLNTGTQGAGVYLRGVIADFLHVTFNDNHSNNLIVGGGAAIFADAGATAYIQDVLADDTDSLANGNLFSTGSGGVISSMGHNLSSDASLATVSAYSPANGDLSSTAQPLSPLAFNGGPTPTFDLLAGPAVAAGDLVGPNLDQDYRTRPNPAHPTASDIGSVDNI